MATSFEMTQATVSTPQRGIGTSESSSAGTTGDFQSVWDSLGLQETLCGDMGATIRASTILSTHSDPARSRSESTTRTPWNDRSLTSLVLANDSAHKADLCLGPVLGEGGMGRVQLATQSSLFREVAVKSIPQSKQTPDNLDKLLQEARITGMLEHPNIIPIHLLGKDETGAPMLVMKRVEGVCWGDILREKCAPPNGPISFDDPFVYHVNVLLDVGNAVQFAHSKGLLHRDLKPDNVMIGAFGEVYLVDWGLAVRFDDQHTPWLPHAKDAQQIAGTPAYMAPEMVTGRGELLDPTTDVYLLGAILHEIIAGRPPHEGESLSATLHCAYRSEPHAYGFDVPRELAAICHKAMHPVQRERYASVRDMQKAIAWYLRHRSSLQLSIKASGYLEQLRLLVEKKEPLSDQDRERLFDLFGQCRFGFQEALNASGDNAQARDGLQCTFELMIRYEIQQQSFHAAEMLLAQLPTPNEELQRQLDQLKRKLAEKEQEIAKLQKFHHEMDQTLGAGTRFYFALAFGAGWGGINFIKGYIERNSPNIWKHYYCMTVDLGALILIPVASYLLRTLLFQNQASRRYVWLAFLLILGLLVQSGLAYLTDISLRQNTFQQVLLATVFASILSVTIDRRIAAIACACAVALGVGIVAPPYVYEALGMASIVSFSFLAYLWRKAPASPITP